MSNQEYSPNKKSLLTLKGLNKKQVDGLKAGGLTLAALVSGIGFYNLFGRSDNSSDHKEANELPAETTDPGISNLSDGAEDIMDSDLLDTESPALTDEAEMTYSFNSEVTFSQNVTDEMNFEEAFTAARNDVGPGGFFNYQGESYSTFLKEEWEGMTLDNRNDFLNQVQENTSFNEVVYVDEGNTEEIVESALIDEFEIVEEDEVKSDNSDAQEDLISGDDFFAEVSNVEDSGITEHVEIDESVVVVRPVFGTDSNDDGVIDMIAIDTNNDGLADVIGIDENADGNLDSFMINEDGGENLDVFIIDEGPKGIDPMDPRENIDNVVSMDDFIMMDEEDMSSIENLDEINSYIDGLEQQESDVPLDDSDTNDFDEIGL